MGLNLIYWAVPLNHMQQIQCARQQSNGLQHRSDKWDDRTGRTLRRQRTMWTRWSITLSIATSLSHSAGNATSDERSDIVSRLTARTAPGEIERLVADLAHPSFVEREFATRRLCAIGMPAYDALRAVRDSHLIEQAYRAQAILDALDRIMFAGVDVQIAISRSEAAWDDPVDLILTLTNRSSFPARVPFEIEPSDRMSQTGDARQVADMIDAAEWLAVIDAHGDALSLHVDDMSVNPDVARVIHDRVEAGPYSVLASGQRAVLTVASFNRGWARYRLLDKGRYRLRLRYVPEWKDEALASSGVGTVSSNEVEISVTAAAPETISRRGAEATVELNRDQSDYVIRITNRTDQHAFLNANFGPAVPFAEGRWVCERGDATREVSMLPGSVADQPGFQRELLHGIGPGDSVEMLRMNSNELHKRFTLLGLNPDQEEVVLYFSYANRCDRAWQLRQDITAETTAGNSGAIAEPLPRRMLTGWHTSNRINVPYEAGGGKRGD